MELSFGPAFEIVVNPSLNRVCAVVSKNHKHHSVLVRRCFHFLQRLHGKKTRLSAAYDEGYNRFTLPTTQMPIQEEDHSASKLMISISIKSNLILGNRISIASTCLEILNAVGGLQ